MGVKHVWLVCWQGLKRTVLTRSPLFFANVPALGTNFTTITLLKLLLISAGLTSSGVYDLIGEDGYENLYLMNIMLSTYLLMMSTLSGPLLDVLFQRTALIITIHLGSIDIPCM